MTNSTDTLSTPLDLGLTCLQRLAGLFRLAEPVRQRLTVVQTGRLLSEHRRDRSRARAVKEVHEALTASGADMRGLSLQLTLLDQRKRRLDLTFTPLVPTESPDNESWALSGVLADPQIPIVPGAASAWGSNVRSKDEAIAGLGLWGNGVELRASGEFARAISQAIAEGKSGSSKGPQAQDMIAAGLKLVADGQTVYDIGRRHGDQALMATGREMINTGIRLQQAGAEDLDTQTQPSEQAPDETPPGDAPSPATDGDASNEQPPPKPDEEEEAQESEKQPRDDGEDDEDLDETADKRTGLSGDPHGEVGSQGTPDDDDPEAERLAGIRRGGDTDPAQDDIDAPAPHRLYQSILSGVLDPTDDPRVADLLPSYDPERAAAALAPIKALIDSINGPTPAPAEAFRQHLRVDAALRGLSARATSTQSIEELAPGTTINLP